MSETRTERGSCRFLIEKAEGGKPVLKVQLFHAVPVLGNIVFGFDLLSGITLEQAKKIADTLNENVLNIFVTLSDAHPMFEPKK